MALRQRILLKTECFATDLIKQRQHKVLLLDASLEVVGLGCGLGHRTEVGPIIDFSVFNFIIALAIKSLHAYFVLLDDPIKRLITVFIWHNSGRTYQFSQ